MFLVRAFVNLLILAVEIGLVLAVAALGYAYPLVFAALTFALALIVGARLEVLRLTAEIGFYFEPAQAGGPAPRAGVGVWFVALSETLLKAVLAGAVALLTFSGTDLDRLSWIAIAFALTVLAGSSVLRWLANRFGARPGRWGYFRIGGLLGVLFSAAIAVLPVPSYGQVGWDLLFNLPQRPSIAQGSEMLFLLKQKFDELVLVLLRTVLPSESAAVVAVLLSVNVLTGFVAGLYAVIAAETVRMLEGGGS